MNLEELIAKHSTGADLRAGFEGKRIELQQQFNRLHATYLIQESVGKEFADKAVHENALQNLEREMRFVGAAIDDINSRLAGADEALNGAKPNRAARRAAERNGA